MIIDGQLLFTGTQSAPAQTITATAVSTNVYDLGAYTGTVTNGAIDIGRGNPLYLFAKVIAAFNNLTSLSISLITSASPNMSSPTTLWTVTEALAALTAASTFALPPLAGVEPGLLRYIALQFTVTGTAPTTGSIEAGIVETLQANKTYGQGVGLGQLP